MGRRAERQLILLIGMPGTGKTTLMRRITDVVVDEYDSVDSVFVLDKTEEWSVELEPYEHELLAQIVELQKDEYQSRDRRRYDGPIVHSLEEYRRYCAMLAEDEESEEEIIPRRVIWRMGPEPESYVPAIREAVDQGNVWIVFPETPDWFPVYGARWPIKKIREYVSMFQLWTQGRAHIKNRDGVRTRISLLTECQFLMDIHWRVRNYPTTVLCSQIEGADTADLIRRNFGSGGQGKEVLERVQKLEPREWIAIRGQMPPLAAFRGGGRP